MSEQSDIRIRGEAEREAEALPPRLMRAVWEALRDEFDLRRMQRNMQRWRRRNDAIRRAMRSTEHVPSAEWRIPRKPPSLVDATRIVIAIVFISVMWHTFVSRYLSSQGTAPNAAGAPPLVIVDMAVFAYTVAMLFLLTALLDAIARPRWIALWHIRSLRSHFRGQRSGRRRIAPRRIGGAAGILLYAALFAPAAGWAAPGWLASTSAAMGHGRATLPVLGAVAASVIAWRLRRRRRRRPSLRLDRRTHALWGRNA